MAYTNSEQPSRRAALVWLAIALPPRPSSEHRPDCRAGRAPAGFREGVRQRQRRTLDIHGKDRDPLHRRRDACDCVLGGNEGGVAQMAGVTMGECRV
jgi:hypothetical protein